MAETRPRLPAQAALEGALADVLTSNLDSTLENLLRLLVDSIGLLTQSTLEFAMLSEREALSARNSAAAASRDSAAASIAMQEARKSAAKLATAGGSDRVVMEASSAAALSPSSSSAENAPELEMAEMSSPMGAEAAVQMAELLVDAQQTASELIALLSKSNVGSDPDAGAEELRRGFAANQREDFAAATAWFEESHRR